MRPSARSFLEKSIRRDTIRIRIAVAFLVASLAFTVFAGVPLWLHWLDVVLTFWGLR